LDFRNEGGRLIIKERQTHNMGDSSNQENRVEVSLGCERCEELSLSVNGSGSAEIVVPFKRGRLSVNGSGDIEAARFDSVECSINGSGDICCASAEDASLSINGSGDITIKKVTRTARAVIRGSGDITIESGTIEHLSVEVAVDFKKYIAPLFFTKRSRPFRSWRKTYSFYGYSGRSQVI
jgi:hypothetical protein